MSSGTLGRVVAVFLGVSVLMALAGCGPETKKTDPRACVPNEEGPVVALIVDTSDSTTEERASGGTYEQDLIEAFEEAAGAESTIWVTFADGNPLGTSTWLVDGCGFQRSGIGGSELQDAALRNQAEDFKPELSKVLNTQAARGSDLLGALYSAERLLSDYPERPRSLVLLTDGALTGTIKANGKLPSTEAGRERLLERLDGQGKLPDLTGGEGNPVAVWIGGLGLGVGDSEKTRSVIELWKVLIPAVNGDLRSEDSTLQLDSDFPAR